MGTPVKNPERPGQPRPKLEFPTISNHPGHGNEGAESATRNFSIVLGGPLYDFLLRHGIVRFALPNVFRRIGALVVLTWLPLLFLSLRDGLAFGHRVQIPFLYDFSVYGRFLVAVPLLLLAEVVIDPAIRQAVAEFVDGRFVKGDELPKFEGVLAKMQELRDSWIPETVLFVLAFFPVFLFQREFMSEASSSWHTINGRLTAAGWWFAAFSTPVLRFIIYRWLFRYFIWTELLRRVSRLNLSLVPTHPDHAAGLNFLGLAQKRFGILFCALGCTFAGSMADRMAFEGAPVTSFKFLMAGFIVLALLLGLLPLMLLAPKLSSIRRKGLLEYGRLASSYTESFDRKWVRNERPSDTLLGTGDIQSLADMGNSFALVDAMTIAPITKRLVLQLAVQSALPLIPVIVLGTPTPELVHAVIKMLA